MDLVYMTDDERIEMMRKRHAFFSKMVEGYTDLHMFFKDNDERFAIMGMELSEFDTHLQIYIQLDFTEYECYYIDKDNRGKLVVRNTVSWDDCCAREEIDIFQWQRNKFENFQSCITE